MPDLVTRQRLIEVAIGLFGENGLNSVGTREIARAAGVQMSAITYHFQSKDGLYLACAEHIAATMREKTAPLLATVGELPNPASAMTAIENVLSGLVMIMLQDEIAPIARFVIREQMSPTPAFDILFTGAMQQIVEPLTKSVSIVAGGRLSEEDARVRCVALMGQVFAFRFARAALMRVTRWKSVSQREMVVVREVVMAHTRAILLDLESGDIR